MSELEDRLINTLSLVIDWLKYAEAKNGAMIALSGGAAAALGQAYLTDNKLPDWTISIILIVMVLLAISTLVGILSFVPILTRAEATSAKSRQPLDTDNLLFFEHLRCHTAEGLVQTVLRLYYVSMTVDLKDQRRLKDIADQIVVNSAIASRKLKYFRTSVYLLMLAIFMLSITGLVLLGS